MLYKFQISKHFNYMYSFWLRINRSIRVRCKVCSVRVQVKFSSGSASESSGLDSVQLGPTQHDLVRLGSTQLTGPLGTGQLSLRVNSVSSVKRLGQLQF
ncbi:hypothetical protein HanIR_Chr10g0468021 [Helianthus annuus]|nr:hypothetical protein HanIR_Chr10g0468021 [Helianthus annuus]